MYLSDKPITINDQKSENEDLLNREEFAKELAKTILNYDIKDNLVIGLTGSWGSGKTSLLNLCEYYIKQQNENQIIVKFNPWNLAKEENDLTYSFFNILEKEISKSKNNIIKKSYSDIKRDISKKTPDVNPEYSVGLDLKIIKGSIKLQPKNSVLYEVLLKNKEKLNETFNKLDQHIIVIIDNIDRLSNEEVNQIFNLVNSTADFDNLIYILSFDRNVVEYILSNNYSDASFSPEFIDKIIQVMIKIPEITYSHLEEIFLNMLSKILIEYTIPFSEDKMKELYNYFFINLNNIREIKRYLNALTFYLGNINLNNINIYDFLMITFIRLYLPEEYKNILNNKKVLVSLKNPILIKHSQLIKNEITDKEEYKQIYQKIFPTVNDNDIYDVKKEKIKNKCICTEEYFDYYFTLNLDDCKITDEELKQILKSVNEYSIFKKEMKKYQNKNNILTYIEIYKEKIDSEKAIISLSYYCNDEPKLTEKIVNLIKLLLFELNEDIRIKIINNIIINNNLALNILLITQIMYNLNDNPNINNPLLKANDFKKSINIDRLVKRIKENDYNNVSKENIKIENIIQFLNTYAYYNSYFNKYEIFNGIFSIKTTDEAIKIINEEGEHHRDYIDNIEFDNPNANWYNQRELLKNEITNLPKIM